MGDEVVGGTVGRARSCGRMILALLLLLSLPLLLLTPRTDLGLVVGSQPTTSPQLPNITFVPELTFQAWLSDTNCICSYSKLGRLI